jgi:hypothetical protein
MSAREENRIPPINLWHPICAAGHPTPGDGKVVRVLRNGQIEEVITGLAVPTGLTFGPEGKFPT